jgi:uncharacterized protein (DUF4415 family)
MKSLESHLLEEQTRKVRSTDNNEEKNGRKVNVTLALDERIVKELRREAQESQQSLNVKINAVLRKHVDYYRMIELNKAAIIQPATHQFFLNEVDEAKYIEHLKEIGKGVISSLLVQKGLAPTLDRLVAYIFGEVCVYGGAIRNVSKYTDEEDGRICIFYRHDYDEKWSRIIAAVFSDLFEKTLHCTTATRIFPNSMEIKILEKRPS